MAEPVGRELQGPSYAALPLGDDSLRLIEFIYNDPDGQPKNTDVPIECTLKVYSLRDRSSHYRNSIHAKYDVGDKHVQHLMSRGQPTGTPEYRFHWGDWVALSHCWGSDQTTERIYINRESYEISASMAAGLRAISQLPAVKYSKLKLWNDFLCLDQSNRAEIQRELKRVPNIYSGAFAVIAWIGQAAENSSLAMDVLRTKLLKSTANKDDSGDILKSIQRSEWRALGHLLRRPYWRRLWVVQELTLAGNRTMLLCGNDTAPLIQMWELIRTIMRNTALCHRLLAEALDNGDSYYDPERNEIFSVMPRMLYMHDVYHVLRQPDSPDGFKLQALLDICKDSQQMWLRDKVFGVLGLLPANIASLIKPDLAKAPHQIFTDFTIATIQAMETLDVLQTCNLHAASPVFPTWTPDLSVKSKTYQTVGRALSNAGGILPSHPHVLEHGRILCCRGYLLDEISHLTPPQWPLDPISESEARDALPRVATYHHSRESVRSAFWQVLFGGSAGFPHDSPPPEDYANILALPWPPLYDTLPPEAVASDLITNSWFTADEKQDLITFVTFRHRAGRDFNLAGHSLATFFPCTEPNFVEQSEVPDTVSKPLKRAMLRQTSYIIKRGRLFVTLDGRLGLCGRQARPGDVVAVLRGCSAPLLLRRWRWTSSDLATTDTQTGFESAYDNTGDPHLQQTYVVVGACYVDRLTRFDEWQSRSPTEEQDVMLI